MNDVEKELQYSLNVKLADLKMQVEKRHYLNAMYHLTDVQKLLISLFSAAKG